MQERYVIGLPWRQGGAILAKFFLLLLLFFIRVYGPRPSRGPLTRKKERGKNPTIFTEQFWLIKGLLYGFLMFTEYHR